MASARRHIVGFLLKCCLISLAVRDTKANRDEAYSIMYDTRWQRDDRIAALQLSMLNEEAGPLLRVRRDVSAPPSSTSSLDYNSTLITRSSVISSTTATTTTTTTTTTTLPQLNVTNTRSSTAPTTSPTSSTTTTIGTTTTTPVTASVPDRESTTQNLTVMEDMNHKYYTSYVVTGKKAESLWVDEEQLASYHSKIHSSLSNNYRVAATVKLSFTFLFYGHEVKQVTIATGGFLYVSEFLHQWLTATQYIAPLMANFDTHIGNSSNIHYADTGSFFVVWWQDVYLKDYPQAGPFSFQAVIHQNGRVIFNYKQVPLDITDIPKAQHPVKIGLSDAYYYDTSTGSGMKRTIYEYHRVEITADRIFNSSSVIIQPLETCIQQKTCEQCLSANISFKCQYCLELRRCSDGLDRYRQEWLNHSCHTQETITLDQCPAPGSLSPPSAIKGRHDINEGAIVAVVFIIVLILVITVVIFYGYLRPQSKIGLWLIEHRPSQLRERLSNVHFFKRRDGGAEKYEVSVQPDGESVA